jgi:hypothetical protein
MRIVATSLVGLLLCGSAAGEAASQSIRGAAPDRKPPAEETVKVTGAVVDRRDGSPLAQAQVSFEGPRRGTAWTDAAGAFEFEGPTGDYGIRVKSGGKSQAFSAKITKDGLQPARFEFDKE